ncbi:MAG: carbon-nitrogen family hydrolase [Methanosarcinaceae archaeon]|nr:carbon-nitrogen family hydrolase [Methanosarcinaceae archaeon]MDD4330849.1 carbon-nitrogen family hydrolase [Methanosarcinaceae archaeon]MDD4748930.1 carbon-nitrogen family hydrolase [Methanosarcinaceae archaeon]
MKVACIQMEISLCSKEENLKRAFTLAKKAILKGAEILVFPEVFLTGFCYAHIEEVAEARSGAIFEALLDFSKEKNCVLVGSLIEKEEPLALNPSEKKQFPAYYNLGFCIDSGKLVGTHRKTHLYGQEKKYFVAGNQISPIKLEKRGLLIGLIICYEIRFPEIARKLALEGAELLISVSEIPAFFGKPWQTLTLARAMENQLPCIACNRTGKDCYSTYFGKSFMADAWGKKLAFAGEKEGILLGEIDLRRARKLRKNSSIFGDRRPELY